MNRKGYVRLSVLAVVLVAALYAVSVYNSKPVSAACDSLAFESCYDEANQDCNNGNSCNQGEVCQRAWRCCGQWIYQCASACGNGVCDVNLGENYNNCQGDCPADYCGDGVKGGQEWNCPQEYPCQIDWRSCASPTSVFNSYTNCDGTVSGCGGGQSCWNNCGGWGSSTHCNPNGVYCKIRDLCEGISCNNPPPAYCSGNIRYYSSSTTCSGGSCPYFYRSQNCATSGCVDPKTRYAGYCSGGSCANSVTNVQDCAASSGWVDTSGCYGACSGTTSITQKNQEYRSYTCSGDSCSYSVTQTRATTCSTGANCAASTGWYDTSSCTGACSGSTPITQKTQQYRSYTCSGAGSCSYSVTDNQAVTCTTGSACAPWTCNGATLCTGGYCTSGSCAAPGSCSTCQPSAPTCVSGSTLRTYSAGCGSGSCNSQASYSDTNCPSGVCDSSSTPNKCSDYRDCSYLNGWYNNGGSYACCPSGTQTGTCQNQELRSYAPAVTCSASTGYSVTNTQTLTSGVTTCSTNTATCADINTRTTYTASCTGSGVCTNT